VAQIYYYILPDNIPEVFHKKFNLKKLIKLISVFYRFYKCQLKCYIINRLTFYGNLNMFLEHYWNILGKAVLVNLSLKI